MKIELRLLGQKIVLKASGNDPRVAKDVVDLVSNRLRVAEKRGAKGSLAPHQVCLLALLDLAEDHIDARDKAAEVRSGMEERLARLQTLVDAELKTAGP